jgi:hypothetical protein
MGEWNLEQFVEGYIPETGAMPVHDDRIWVVRRKNYPVLSSPIHHQVKIRECDFSRASAVG